MPFVEFFNLFNRNNPGANYVTNVASEAHISELRCGRSGMHMG
jgi:hypothetical protein